jgi:quercetin dioxygenase-like cupin family protein
MVRVNPYKEFLAQEGLPVYTGFAVEDVRALELAPWARRGGRGAYVDLDGNGGTNNAYVAEIPPGGSLEPGHQMFEEMVLVVDGAGSTQVWYDPAHKLSFEWKAGSLFAIPLNAWHQHHNGQGTKPARLLAVTSLPAVLNLYHSTDFIFNCAHQFLDRFNGEENYFDGQGKLYQRRVLQTNFVPDTATMELYEWKERGAGGRNVMFELANNTMAAHVSEFPVGTYKKAHRHGPGAHVVLLGGEGYSLLWREGEDMTETKWKRGSIIVPPNDWFHQHFNSGREPARYVALKWGSRRWDSGPAFASDVSKSDVSVKDGGLQIEYPDEDPRVHRIFEDYLRASGTPCRMKGMSPYCTA